LRKEKATFLHNFNIKAMSKDKIETELFDGANLGFKESMDFYTFASERTQPLYENLLNISPSKARLFLLSYINKTAGAIKARRNAERKNVPLIREAKKNSLL